MATSFDAIKDIAASGMFAERLRVQLGASNIANSETTRTPEGGPYRRKEPVFQAEYLGALQDGVPVTGVKVAGIQASNEPFISKVRSQPSGRGRQRRRPVSQREPPGGDGESHRGRARVRGNVAVVRAVRAMELSAQDLLRVQ